MLIKGVTVVRTAKGSGHVLVTTADQVCTMDLFDLWLHFGCIKLIWVCVTKKLIVRNQIRSFPLFRCDKARSCGQCVALQVANPAI